MVKSITVIKNFFKNKAFIKMALGLAIPIAFHNMLLTSVNLIDTLMVGRLNAEAIAAVGLCNKFYFAFYCTIYGITSGNNIFMAQFHGANDKKGIQKVFSITTAIGLILGFFAFLLCRFKPYAVMSVFTNNEKIIEEGVKYFNVIAISYLTIPLLDNAVMSLRSIKKVKIAVVASLTGLIVNVILNYLLIEGHCGFPRLEVRGAAFATVIARFVELLIYYIYIFCINKEIFDKFSQIFTFDFDLLKKMTPYTIPVLCNEILWGYGISSLFIAFGRLDSNSIAAINIMYEVENMVYAFFIGIGCAASTIVGNALGNKEYDNAKTYGQYMFIMAIFVSSILFIIAIFVKPIIMCAYANLGIEFLEIFSKVYNSAMVWIVPLAINFLMICGIFRSGGDTKIPAIIDITSLVLFAIIPTFLGVFVWHLPTHIVFLLSYLDEGIKALFSIFRFYQYKWIKNVIN